MIASANRRIRDWIHDALGEVTISFAPPGVVTEGDGIGVYLLEMNETPPARNGRPPPLLIDLRYLVTTFGADIEIAHNRLVELAFAAMRHPQFDAEVRPLDAAAWFAFRALPQPSFLLKVQLRFERPHTSAKPVREPLVAETVPLASLRGRVLGPDDVPLPMAWVELTSLGLVSYTDSDGWFAFGAIPSEPGSRRLRVRVKGKELALQTDKGGKDEEPLVIHFKSLD